MPPAEAAAAAGRAGAFPVVIRPRRRLRRAVSVGRLKGRLCVSSGVPSKCELAVFTWERRLRGRGARVGRRRERMRTAGARRTTGTSGPARSRTRPARGEASPSPAATLGLCSGFFESSSGCGGGAEAGAPARRGVPGAMERPAPPPPRLLPAPRALYMLGPRANQESEYSSRPWSVFCCTPHP